VRMVGGCDGWCREDVVKPIEVISMSRDAVRRVTLNHEGYGNSRYKNVDVKWCVSIILGEFYFEYCSNGKWVN
jgi:hypothetical protein